MKVILEIDEKFAGGLSITVTRSELYTTYMSVQAVDLTKYNYIKLDAEGHWTQERVAEDGDET